MNYRTCRGMGKEQSSRKGLNSLALCSDEEDIMRANVGRRQEMKLEELTSKALAKEGVGASSMLASGFQGRKKRSLGGGATACEVEGISSSLRNVSGCGKMQGIGVGGCPRDRLQRHRLQVAGTVRIPDAWCGEARLHEWVSSRDVEDALQPPGLFSARAALISARSSPGPPPGTVAPSLVPPIPCEVSPLLS